MQDYDFIGVSERMLESLVVLQLILGLNTSDILFLNAKTQGGFDDGVFHQQCTYIQPSYLSSNLLQFLDSHQWHNFTRGDSLLYVAVNKSLDLTIDALGRKTVEKKVKYLEWALSQVQTRCTDEVVFPCSKGGVFAADNDCLLWDSGCGYNCIDRVVEELNIQ